MLDPDDIMVKLFHSESRKRMLQEAQAHDPLFRTLIAYAATTQPNDEAIHEVLVLGMLAGKIRAEQELLKVIQNLKQVQS